MAIEKMTLVQITGKRAQINEALTACLKSECFAPEMPLPVVGKVSGFVPNNEENVYKGILARMDDIAMASGIALDDSVKPATQADVAVQADSFVSELQSKVQGLIAQKEELTNQINNNDSSLSLIQRFNSLGADLDDIFACDYLKFRFGKLPLDSYEKLQYYQDRLFLFMTLSETDDAHFGVCVTTEAAAPEVDDIFSSLYFERLWIPETVHGTPGEATLRLEEANTDAKATLAKVNSDLSSLVNQNSEAFKRYYAAVSELNNSFDMRRYVSVSRDLFHVVGFIPTRMESGFKQLFDSVQDVSIDFRPHDSDKRLQTPTKLKNNWFCKPFEMFVEMYGYPAYSEIDPTAFLAVTYTLLFGIMFGDLGQGLGIALLGAVLYMKKKMAFGRILTRIGCSSAIFGLLYGSVFGLEHALDPMYHALGFAQKPIEVMAPDTITSLLLAAIALGVVLLIASMLLNVALGIKNKNVEQALFSQNGVAGLVLYCSVLVGVVLLLMAGIDIFSPVFIVLCIVLPVLIIFLKEPLTKIMHGGKQKLFADGFGSFFIDSFFELFDVALSFVTNTMSFLRVGGFIISHAGMMAVVLTLSEMMSGTGSIVALVIGNLFVMALEGFIVGIQALRIEFYELFSHYYGGQGKAFATIGIRSEK